MPLKQWMRTRACRRTIRGFLARVRAGGPLPVERADDEVSNALAALAEARDKGSVPVLLELLATQRYYGTVTWVLAEIGDQRAIPKLKELFEHTDSQYVRAQCAEALMNFDQPALRAAGVDVAAVMPIARPGIVKTLWSRAESICKRMGKLEKRPGGDPWTLLPEMEAVLQKCLFLDKTEARKLITAVRKADLRIWGLHDLCDRLLGLTE